MNPGSIIYTRKSEEDKKRQVLSLDGQLEVSKQLIESHKLPHLICAPFAESKSGKIPDMREGFKEMVKLLEAGQADTIVCWRINRLARNGKEAGQIIGLIDNNNVKVVSETGLYDKNNSMMVWLEMMQATEFSKGLSKDVKRGMDKKTAQGHASQKAYLGYLNTPEKLKGEKCILVDPKRWDLMREWFDLLLTGQYTVMDSLEFLTAKGLRTRKNEVISKTTAYRTIGNVFYTGRFERNGEVHQGLHKRMITDEEYCKIQEIIKGTPHKPKEEENPLPYMGIMKCGECGRTITGETKSKLIKKTGENKKFSYYRCVKPNHCHQAYTHAEELNKQVREYLDKLEIHPDFIKLVRDVMKRRNVKEFEIEKKHREIQTKNLDNLMDKKKDLYGMKVDGIISIADYEKGKAELLAEEIQIKKYLNHDSTDYWGKVIDQTLNFAQTIREKFDSGDINQKILVLKVLSSNLILFEKKIDISPKYAFLFLKQAEENQNISIEPNSNLENNENLSKKPFGAIIQPSKNSFYNTIKVIVSENPKIV